MKVWRNGILQFMHYDPNAEETDVYPGSDNTKIKFTCDLIRGDTIVVEIL
jgi:hypothetical protein